MKETFIFKDSTSFKPAITASDPWVNYDNRILHVERAEVESTEKILPVYTIEEFQQQLYVDDLPLVKDKVPFKGKSIHQKALRYLQFIFLYIL